MKLKGLIPPMVTPLDVKRRLDKKGTKNMVNHLLKGGVDGIFLLGTTGEGPDRKSTRLNSSHQI